MPRSTEVIRQWRSSARSTPPATARPSTSSRASAACRDARSVAISMRSRSPDSPELVGAEQNRIVNRALSRRRRRRGRPPHRRGPRRWRARRRGARRAPGGVRGAGRRVPGERTPIAPRQRGAECVRRFFSARSRPPAAGGAVAANASMRACRSGVRDRFVRRAGPVRATPPAAILAGRGPRRRPHESAGSLLTRGVSGRTRLVRCSEANPRQATREHQLASTESKSRCASCRPTRLADG